MDGNVLPVLIALLVASLVLLVLIYYFAVSRTLPLDHDGTTGRPAFWRVIRRFKLYREIRASHSDSLSTYYVAVILTWFAILLAAIIVIMILWQNTHPLE